MCNSDQFVSVVDQCTLVWHNDPSSIPSAQEPEVAKSRMDADLDEYFKEADVPSKEGEGEDGEPNGEDGDREEA